MTPDGNHNTDTDEDKNGLTDGHLSDTFPVLFLFLITCTVCVDGMQSARDGRLACQSTGTERPIYKFCLSCRMIESGKRYVQMLKNS